MAGGYSHDRYILYTERNTYDKITRHSLEPLLCTYDRVFLAMACSACYLDPYLNRRGGMVAKTLFGQIENLVRFKPLL